uniref:DUF6821 domain-containing protein n=1 Tax=Leersia perrieri TaxID=77586 RepID=A0A0D9WWP2_9ORYZ
MEKGGVSVPMDDAASMDMWDWEVLPDHMNSSTHGGHGRSILADQESEEHNLPPPEEDGGADMAVGDHVECKDIGVDVPAETKTSQEEDFKNSDAKLIDGGGGEEEEGKFAVAGEEEEEEEGGVGEKGKKGRRGSKREECVVFGVGKLRVNGIGALCSFGVAAATVCIFLVGGRLQHHHKQQQQQHKIQLQLCGDDKRMQQVVQQTSRLNQAMSSVMGGGGSTKANISFGGYYDGF